MSQSLENPSFMFHFLKFNWHNYCVWQSPFIRAKHEDSLKIDYMAVGTKSKDVVKGPPSRWFCKDPSELTSLFFENITHTKGASLVGHVYTTCPSFPKCSYGWFDLEWELIKMIQSPQKQTFRLMEQNRGPRNKPTSPQSINLQQWGQEYAMDKRLSLQQVVLGNLGRHM